MAPCVALDERDIEETKDGDDDDATWMTKTRSHLKSAVKRAGGLNRLPAAKTQTK